MGGGRDKFRLPSAAGVRSDEDLVEAAMRNGRKYLQNTADLHRWRETGAEEPVLGNVATFFSVFLLS